MCRIYSIGLKWQKVEDYEYNFYNQFDLLINLTQWTDEQFSLD